MKKIKIGNPQFPNRYIEKEFSDNKDSVQIAAELLIAICDKAKIKDKLTNRVSIKKRSANFKSMLNNFEKEIYNIDPKLASELRLKTHKK